MSISDSENALLQTIEKLAEFIDASINEKDKLESLHASMVSQISGASNDMARAKRALACLRGEDELQKSSTGMSIQEESIRKRFGGLDLDGKRDAENKVYSGRGATEGILR